MRRTKHVLARVLPAVVAGGALIFAAAPAQAAPAVVTAPAAVRADVIGESLPLGYYATAVAIEYDKALTLTKKVSTSAFSVTATMTGIAGVNTAPRTVTKVYTNNKPARIGSDEARGHLGKYLILELDTADPNSSITFFNLATFQTGVSPMDGAMSIVQNSTIRTSRGPIWASTTPLRSTSMISPVIDDFAAKSFTGSNGLMVRYREFQPAKYQARPNRTARYPLVLALHGAGESGTNNISQIVANQISYAFAEPGRQRTDPSFVISPQATAGWSSTTVQATLIELVREAMAKYPIDPSRVYLTGLSMGSMGSWTMLGRYPDVFAGALLVCGGGNLADVPALKSIPIWATHSIDDPSVAYTGASADKAMVDAIAAAGSPVVYGAWDGNLSVKAADAYAKALWKDAKAKQSHTLFTTFNAGTTPVNAHWSWVPTYQNTVMLDWLYAQHR